MFGSRFILLTTLFANFFLVVGLIEITEDQFTNYSSLSNRREINNSQFIASIKDELENLYSSCEISPKYPETIQQWCPEITFYSREFGIEPDLIAAIIWVESKGDKNAYSQSGAVGLMQIMPRDGIAAGFNCINGPCFHDRPTIDELLNPEFNISYGINFLVNLIEREGSLREALKFYGPINVGYTYADQILSIYQKNSD